MNWFIGCVLKLYLYLHERIHERILHTLAIRYFHGLHPKNIFHYRSEFFKENLEQNDIVLDIACGTGKMLSASSSQINKGIGIDYDKKNIDLAMQNHSAKNLEFIVADIDRYDYADLKSKINYNKAIFSHILEHIENVPALLRKVNAREILICVPSQENWYRQTLKHMHLRYTTDPTHFREYTKEMLLSELREAGYEVKYIGYNSEGELICRALQRS